MKYYKNENTNSDYFIKKYKIKNGEIIAELASGENYRVPHTKENEEEILRRMESQVTNAYYRPFSMLDKVNFGILPISTVINLIGTMDDQTSSKVLLGLLAFCDFCYIIRLCDYINVKQDLKKNKYFLKNKDYINGNFKPINNMMLGLSSKTQNKILENNSNEIMFDINNISDYSLGDLKKIVSNIERAHNFNFVDEDKQEKIDNSKSL